MLREAAPYYRIFGLDERATFAQVKVAYRKMAKQYHPDAVSSKGRSHSLVAVEKFKRINNAYNYLRRIHSKKQQDRSSGWLGFSITMGKFNNSACPVVSHVAECSPAALAGLRLNDYIIGFNDRSTLGMTRKEIVSLFSGKPGVPVKIRIYRKSKKVKYTLYAIRFLRTES